MGARLIYLLTPQGWEQAHSAEALEAAILAAFKPRARPFQRPTQCAPPNRTATALTVLHLILQPG
jgi:hypothetical protein